MQKEVIKAQMEHIQIIQPITKMIDEMNDMEIGEGVV